MILPNIEAVAQGFQARHILTPLSKVSCVGPRTSESVAWKELADGRFDAAPVRDGGGQLTGFVERKDLEPSADASLAAKVKPLASSQLISAETPLSRVLADFGATPFLFVVDEGGIAGIVTPADLNKQAGRAYFYVLVSTLEVLLAERLRERDGDCLDGLSPSRRQRIKQRIHESTRADVFTDEVSAMDFVDLLNLARAIPELSEPGSKSKSVWNHTVVTPIERRRNCVMHSVRALTSNSPDGLRRLQEADTLLQDLIARASAPR